MHDSGDVHRMAHAAEQLARSQPMDDGAALHLGFAMLRRAEFDGRLYDRARGIFGRIDRANPAQVYPVFGIGLAEEGKGDWLANEPANLGTRVGHGAYRSAVKAFLVALDREPDFTPALFELARLVAVLRDTSVTHDVLVAHRRAHQTGLRDTQFLLNLGSFERAAGSLDSAIQLFTGLRSTRDSAIATLELVRTGLANDSAADLALYDSVASTGDSTVIAMLRSDIAPIASDSELAEYDQVAAGEHRMALLRRFWSGRDARDLRAPGERLREHYRRLLYVRRHFLLGNNRRYYASSDLYRSPAGELDDRGVVYLRQGAPDQRLTPLLFGLNPNETWVYHRPDGDLVLHFSSGGQRTEGGDLSDFRLVGSVMDLRGRDVPLDMRLLSRASVSDIYNKMLSWGPFGAARAAALERRIGEESTAEAVTTDRHPLQFTTILEAHADLVPVGTRDGDRLVHVAFSLRLPPGGGAGERVPVQLRLSLLAPDDSVVRWIDTVTSARIGTGGVARGLVSFTAPAGQYRYQLAVMRGDSSGAVLPRGDLSISPSLPTKLTMSGLALGLRGASSEWDRAPGDTVLLVSERTFSIGDDVELYYELYGLAPDHRYQTRISLYDRRQESQGQRRLALSFEGRSRNQVTVDHKTIRLEGVKRGEYWLEVMVVDESGRETAARQVIRVKPAGKTSPRQR
jgi:GWxTD domain-containing protein